MLVTSLHPFEFSTCAGPSLARPFSPKRVAANEQSNNSKGSFMSATNSGASASSETAIKDWSEFYQWRRQYIDEILFGRNMTAVEKLAAIAIAYSTNRETRTTFEGYSTFAKRLGLKMKVFQDAAGNLQFNGRLKIETRHGRKYLMPVIKGDAPHRSTGGGKDFYGKRGAFCEVILNRSQITPAARIAYFGIAALTDPATGNYEEGNAYVARLIGISSKTMTRAIEALSLAGVLIAKGNEGLETTLSVCDPSEVRKTANPGHRSGHHPDILNPFIVKNQRLTRLPLCPLGPFRTLRVRLRLRRSGTTPLRGLRRLASPVSGHGSHSTNYTASCSTALTAVAARRSPASWHCLTAN
jgi:hypothetical protein